MLSCRCCSTCLQVSEIQAEQVAAEAAAQQLWDQRYQLRRRPLAELRDMARQVGVPGRSRMRKAELAVALEQHLGLSSAESGSDEFEWGSSEDEVDAGGASNTTSASSGGGRAARR